MRPFVRLFPQLLELLGRHELHGELEGHLAQAGLERRRDELGALGQCLFGDRFDIDLVEEGVRDLGGSGVNEIGVRSKRRNRADVTIRVEHLVANPDRHDGERREDTTEHHEEARGPAAPASRLRRLRGRGRVS
jgi:hypothetical protein